MQCLLVPSPRQGAGMRCLLALLAVLGSACGSEALPPGSYWKVVQRFATQTESGARPILAAAPTVTILDDTRYVLAAPPSHVLVWPFQIPPDARQPTIPLAPLVPGSWQHATAVVVMPQLLSNTRLTLLPPRVVPTERKKGRTLVRFGVDLPPAQREPGTQISVLAYALDVVDLGSQTMPPVEIPEAAELEFAIGLIDPRIGFDPVDFLIKACSDGDCQRVFFERLDPRDEYGPRWRNRRISLARLAGTRQQLVFETRRASEQAPFSLPVWASPTLYAPAPRRAEQVNVILLSLDTLRADHLSPYGYRRDTSPFMAERFGKHGTLFENLVASATFTTASHASMFTSLQPITHQMTEGMKLLSRDVTTLAEVIRHAGVDTGAVTEDGWLSINFGFGRGFDSFRESKSVSLMFAAGEIERTFGDAVSWLRWNRDKHFFLFLHTFQVHSPYAPPARYAGLFDEHEGKPIDDSSPSHVRDMANYDREIRYTDDQLRGLFESIDELGLGENTVFIVTSDHGEAFLEHGLLEHGGYLTEEIVRVPLMLWGRGIPEGRRIAAPVSHVDLMPTILDLLGLHGPALTQGSSLLASLRASAIEPALAQRPLFSESPSVLATGPEHSRVEFRGPAYMVRRGNRKLARYPTENGVEYRYFDLASDPLEQRNLYPTRASEAADLLELLESNELHSAALRARIAAGKPSADSPARPPVLDPQQAEKLRALGYLD
jgi:arylsulfatase A-like enzyme